MIVLATMLTPGRAYARTVPPTLPPSSHYLGSSGPCQLPNVERERLAGGKICAYHDQGRD